MKWISTVLLCGAALTALAATALAGHNAGAALIVHTTAFSKTSNCSGLRTAIAHCEDANPTSPAGEGQDFVLAVYATRPDSLDPVYGEGVTLNAVDFGIEYSNAMVASWHHCGDFEVSTGGGGIPSWPASGSGNTVTWTDPFSSAQGEVVLIGYFSVYVYGAGTFEITAHPQVGAARLLDEVSEFDEVSLLGSAGFSGASGVNLCPEGGGDSLEGDDTYDDGERSDGSQTRATITVAEGNLLVYQTWDRTIVYKGGDTVQLEWGDGTCYVNGLIHKPHPAGPIKTYDLSLLMSMYAEVPMVKEYVKSHAGDATDVWNAACRRLDEEMQRLTTSVAREYASVLQGTDQAAATETALNSLRASRLIASARRDDRVGVDEEMQTIVIRWAGVPGEELLMLSRTVEERHPQPPMRLDGFQSFISMMRSLETSRPVRIELKCGNINYFSGDAAIARNESHPAGERREP